MKGFILTLGLATGLFAFSTHAQAQYFPPQPPPGWSPSPHAYHAQHAHHQHAPVGVYKYHPDPWGGHLHYIPARPACESRYQPYGMIPVAPVVPVPLTPVVPTYGYQRYPSYNPAYRPGLSIGFTYVR